MADITSDEVLTPEGIEKTDESLEQTEMQEKTFTQEQVNKIIAERLSRAKVELPDDYKELKERAEKFESLEKQFASELEEKTKELETLKAEKEHSDLVQKVAKAKGIPAHLIHGETEEELEQSANALLEFKESLVPAYPTDKGGSVKGAGMVSVESIENISAVSTSVCFLF